MIQNFPHPLTRPSLSRYFLHPSFLPLAYLIFVCLARLTSSPPLPIIFALTFTAPSMASSSTNPNILTALSEEESLIHDFTTSHSLLLPDPNSFAFIFKLLSPRTVKPAWIEKVMSEARLSVSLPKSLNTILASFWLLSNVMGIAQELFPRSSSPTTPQRCQESGPVHSPPRTTTITTSTRHPYFPSFPDFTSTIPPPIMTTSTITHIAKGKGIALRISSPPRTRPIGLVINEPSTQSSPTSSVGTRKHFTRQSTQVGNSVRSMLKRACAAPNEDAVVPSLSDVEHPPRKMSFCSWNARVLANRLKSVLHSVISPNQSAFLTGRQITDNIVIGNEIIHAIHSRKSGKLGWAAIKLDMEKAFDRVEWSFISHFLHHIGVPQRFTSLITKCLSTVTYQLSLNGNLSNVFSSSRGIRQGNALSPYLFLIVAEGFSAAIRLHEEAALFSGIKICRGAPSFSHLLFADDRTNLPSSSHQILPLIPNPDSDPPCSSMAKVSLVNTLEFLIVLDYQDAQIHSSVSSMTNNHSPAVQDHILLPSTTALFVDATLSTNAPTTYWDGFMQGPPHIQQPPDFQTRASSPILPSAQALCEGLQWCLSSNLTPRFIFSDCINLVSKVNGNWHDYSPLSTLVHRRNLPLQLPSVTLSHVSRQRQQESTPSRGTLPTLDSFQGEASIRPHPSTLVSKGTVKCHASCSQVQNMKRQGSSHLPPKNRQKNEGARCRDPNPAHHKYHQCEARRTREFAKLHSVLQHWKLPNVFYERTEKYICVEEDKKNLKTEQEPQVLAITLAAPLVVDAPMAPPPPPSTNSADNPPRIEHSAPVPQSTPVDRPLYEDIRSPYYLSNSDHPSMALVTLVLTDRNFQPWKRDFKLSIGARNKTPFLEGNGPRIFELNETLTYLHQGDDSVSAYFTKLTAMWDEINQLRPRIPCTFVVA
uniref:Reverse transcriptase domain-containing protein n=1 Tax=Cannabis sativa TaxID=3483 RepID=A0A803PKB0_CANSA